ncbi:Squalene epoxidase [Dispira simplex]|nr:Squalene epoxidase [Dispira simplex]
MEQTAIPLLTPSSRDSNIVHYTGSPIFEYDVIVVGGGVAGAALAYALGTNSRKVLMVERDLSQPDRIVGEFMQPGGIEALKRLGLESTLKDIDGIIAQGYVVCYEGKQVMLPYPHHPTTGKPYRGISFHHGRFVSNLRKAAMGLDNVTVQQGTVNQLIEDPEWGRVVGVTYTPNPSPSKDIADQKSLASPTPVFAPITVVADGGSSKFRNSYLTLQPKGHSQFYGFIMRDCTLPAPNHGHVILSKIAPVLMYQIDTHETRVLVDVPNNVRKEYNNDVRKYLVKVVLPDIPKSLQTKFVEGLETSRMRFMPNRFLPTSSNRQDGLIFLGDALNMRHPLTGGGMTVALWDVVHLKQLLAPNMVPSLRDTHTVLAQLQTFYWQRKSRSSAINILAQALYQLFSAQDDPDLRVLRQACFDYFQLGGTCVSTPVGLLGGIYSSPLLLMYHFFAVVLYGMFCFLGSSSSPWVFVCNLARSVSVLWKGCKVFLPLLWTEIC